MSSKIAGQRTQIRQRHQAALEQELSKARGRIRTLDSLSVLLVVAVAVLVYASGMILLDQFVRFSEGMRQLLLGGFGLAVAGYLVWALVLPLTRQINPYFAARALERSLPDTKNGLINWLDLRREPLSPSVRDAVQSLALEELQQADVEQAIPSRWPLRLFGATVGLIVLIVVLRFIWPDQFGSLVQRAFYPFTPRAVPTHTRLQLKQPVEDDIIDDPQDAPTLPIRVERRRMVTIAVDVDGVVPPSVWLEYTSSLIPRPVKRSLAPPDKDQGRPYWSITLQEQDIPNDGLTFRVIGGDGSTRLYQLLVEKGSPEIEGMEAVLDYPAYLKRPPSQQNFGQIRAPEGTTARLTATADQAIKSGVIEIRVKGVTVQTLSMEADASLPADDVRRDRRLTLREPWVLSRELKPKDPAQPLTYRIQMLSTEGKTGWSPEYKLDIQEDNAPWAIIKQIGAEIIEEKTELVRLPLNDVAPIRGITGDDHAVRKIGLRLQTVPKDGRLLRELFLFGGKAVDLGTDTKGIQQPRPFAQPPEEFQLVLDLTKLTEKLDGEKSKPFELNVGDRLELWVEPTDYREPKPNIGESRHLIIELTEPLEKKEQEEKKDQAQDQQQKFDEQRKEQQERRDQQNQPMDQKDNKEQDPNKNQGGDPKDQKDAKDPMKNQGGDPKDQKDAKDPMKNQGGDPKDQKDAKDPMKNQGGDPKDQKDAKDPMKNQGGDPKDQKDTKDPMKNQGGDPKDQKDAKDPMKNQGGDPKDQKDAKDPMKNQGGDPKDQKDAKDPMKNQGGDPKDQKDAKDPMKNQGGDPKDQKDAKDPMKNQGGDPKDQKDAKDPMKNQGGDPKDQKDPKDPMKNQGGDPKDQKDAKDPMKNQGGDPKDQKDAKDPMKNQGGDPKDQKDAKDPMKNQGGDPKDQKDAKDPMKNQGGDPKDQKDAKDPMKNQGGDPKDQKDAKDPMKNQGGDPKDQKDPKDPMKNQGGDPKDQKDAKDPMKNQGGDPKDQKDAKDPMKNQGGDPKDQKDAKDPMKNQGGDPKDQKDAKDPMKNQGGDPKDQKDTKDPMKNQGGDPKDQKDAKDPMKNQGGDPKDQKDAKDPMKNQGGDPKDQKDAKDPMKNQGGDPKDQKDQNPDKFTPEQRKEAEEAAKKAEELADAANGQHNPTFDPKQRGNSNVPPSPPDKENKEHAAKATDLTLDSLREKMKRGEVDKDVLKKMNWTEEEMRRFLDQHQRLKDQGVLDQVRGPGKGKTTGIGRGPTELRNQRDLILDPSQQPPPELKAAWEAFSRKRAEKPK